MTPSNTIKKVFTHMGIVGLLAGGPLVAGDYGKAIVNDKMPIEAPWHFCDIFDYSTLYRSETGLIRKISLSGRYHGQHISQQESINDTVNNGFHQWQHRRARLGMKIDMAHDLTLATSLDISDGAGDSGAFTRDRFFNNYDEMYLKWAPSKTNYVIIGKHKQKISREFSTSSNSIKTIERSHIVNETTDQKPWGVAVGFATGDINHEIGAWLTGQDGDWNTPRTNSRGSMSYRMNIPVTEVTTFFLDYAYTNNSSGTVNPRGSAPDSNASPYEHVVALGTVNDFGRLVITTDVIMAANRTRQGGPGPTAAIPAGNDTWGFVFLPTYEITEKLEAVFKYAYMDEGRNQRTQRFGNSNFARTNVENYHTFYAGLNYYLCGNNLKLMAGYEYATGDVFQSGGLPIDSGTWMLALRTSF